MGWQGACLVGGIESSPLWLDHRKWRVECCVVRLESESGLTSAGPAGQAWDLGLYIKCNGKPLEGFKEEPVNDTKFIFWKDQNGYKVETGWMGEARGGYS